MLDNPDVPDDWRRRLGSRIAWTVVLKLLALALLWFLFFRGRPA